MKMKGIWNQDKLDIAVGRILADTPQRAKELVDKIEGYYQKKLMVVGEIILL